MPEPGCETMCARHPVTATVATTMKINRTVTSWRIVSGIADVRSLVGTSLEALPSEPGLARETKHGPSRSLNLFEAKSEARPMFASTALALLLAAAGPPHALTTSLVSESCLLSGVTPTDGPLNVGPADGFTARCYADAKPKGMKCDVISLGKDAHAGKSYRTIPFENISQTARHFLWVSLDGRNHLLIDVRDKKFAWAQTLPDMERGGILQKQCAGTMVAAP